MNTFSDKRTGIVCAGNWIVDICHTIDRWPHEGELADIVNESIGVGGGSANVTFDLKALGASFPVTAVGCLSDDEHGVYVKQLCQERDIDTQYLHVLPNCSTAHTHVMNVVGGGRTFFYHSGANSLFDADHIPIKSFSEAAYKIFYLGYILLLDKLDHVQENGQTAAAQLLKEARQLGLITCVDLVSQNQDRFQKVVNPALPHIDYLIINELELTHASGLSIQNTQGQIDLDLIEIAARKILDQGVQCAVIVHAPECALWITRDQKPIISQSNPIPKNQIVSSVGAGDAFCSAVLFGIHESWSINKTLAVAHIVAAACLKGKTATDNIPHMDEVLSQINVGEYDLAI